jgi:murein L,D-transpeptidase YcbB/YkuD
MRLEKPLDLAEYLLDGTRWSRLEIERTIEAWRETRIALENPLPFHVLYWTAWADERGVVHFRPDIYGRDRALAEELASSKHATNSNLELER